jgi:hypothetical protein
VILAPARLAMKRWVAGGIARSSRQSRCTVCRAILVADPGRAVAGLCRNHARDARDDIDGQQPFERGDISSLGGVDERVEESLVLGGADLPASFAGEMEAPCGRRVAGRLPR